MNEPSATIREWAKIGSFKVAALAICGLIGTIALLFGTRRQGVTVSFLEYKDDARFVGVTAQMVVSNELSETILYKGAEAGEPAYSLFRVSNWGQLSAAGRVPQTSYVVLRPHEARLFDVHLPPSGGDFLVRVECRPEKRPALHRYFHVFFYDKHSNVEVLVPSRRRARVAPAATASSKNQVPRSL